MKLLQKKVTNYFLKKINILCHQKPQQEYNSYQPDKMTGNIAHRSYIFHLPISIINLLDRLLIQMTHFRKYKQSYHHLQQQNYLMKRNIILGSICIFSLFLSQKSVVYIKELINFFFQCSKIKFINSLFDKNIIQFIFVKICQQYTLLYFHFLFSSVKSNDC
ncbi:transmembrane protein, putative (macronuclear) [Tetrahymena thermophila SB210]|uniref:Transmembrane protein, putative n=1 Tax=Tetrahymena thermophila (strain SB210) TaxID=312017 RepID=W7XJ67_TETTS|nr:transmembrane protein, putative [Tetrahymena thermophila SB210]EWS73899.1 transmembrane protein, putative [Tetrahymena thermophila SB210]|eukprot:XP_012653567.1 transmembrane protein, putative [Tetrahymena thermophila SB210]